MKPLLLIFLLSIALCSPAYSQQLKVNKNLDVRETKVSVDNFSGIGTFSCLDSASNNVIYVRVSTPGEKGYTIELQLIKDKIVPKVFQGVIEYVSGELDRDSNIPITEKYVDAEMAIKEYSLEMNNTAFKKGDIVKAKFNIVAVNLNSGEKEFKGEIFHVLNGELTHWIGGKFYTNAIMDKLLEKKQQ